MKLKYIIPSLMAVMAMFVSCSDDDGATYLNGVQVSQSFVPLSTDGGSNTITLTAKSDWKFETQRWIAGKDTTYAAAPSWLTISPESGSAGEVQITFTAESTLDGRTAELLLTSGDETQRINIIQGTSTVSEATCAEVIAGPDSKTYRVTGTVTKIVNTVYGNWYLNDGTSDTDVYIYGTLDKNGSAGQNNSIAAWGIDVGDVITIEGPKTTYNGTVELVDVTVVSIKKSLVKIEEGGENAFDAAGGDFKVRLTVNGNTPSVKIDDDAKSWLTINNIEQTDSTMNIDFHVAENNSEDDRSATIEFTSATGSTSSTVTATVSQMGLKGTLANPFTVAEAIAYCNTQSGTSANDVYIKGKISKISSTGLFGSYGNATFAISDDGEYKGTVNAKNNLEPDTEHDFEVYRAIWLGNQKWVEGNAQIAEGDEVIICGKVTLYNGISETSSGAAYVYSINSVTTDENGIGNLNAPFNSAGAKAFIDNGGTNNVYVKGIVSSIQEQFGAKYGNGTFWISDDGKSKDFEAYRALWLGNQKWVEGNDELAVGDEVILYGALTKYGSTYETSSGKAYVYSHNGKTE